MVDKVIRQAEKLCQVDFVLILVFGRGWAGEKKKWKVGRSGGASAVPSPSPGHLSHGFGVAPAVEALCVVCDVSMICRPTRQRNCAHIPPHTPHHLSILYIHTGKGGGFVDLLVADAREETEGDINNTHNCRKEGKRIIQNIHGAT